MISSGRSCEAREIDRLPTATWSQQYDFGEVVIHASKLLWLISDEGMQAARDRRGTCSPRSRVEELFDTVLFRRCRVMIVMEGKVSQAKQI